jgi:Bacterial regulatory helix-turn-helix protein, lysR family
MHRCSIGKIKYFLAVARIGTISGAARGPKVDYATVSRRLCALEGEIKTRLIERQPKATLLRRSVGTCSNWRRKWKRARTLFKDSWMLAIHR